MILLVNWSRCGANEMDANGYEPLDTDVIENVVRELTALGDVWRVKNHVIYMLRDGIPAGATASMLIARNRRITVVLMTIMEITGQLVTDNLIDDITEFVENPNETLAD